MVFGGMTAQWSTDVQPPWQQTPGLQQPLGMPSQAHWSVVHVPWQSAPTQHEETAPSGTGGGVVQRGAPPAPDAPATPPAPDAPAAPEPLPPAPSPSQPMPGTHLPCPQEATTVS